MSKRAKLTLVGAGPGDPELITVKGVKALQTADVVLYDALAHPDLLKYAPKALHIPVGKRGGEKSITQDRIHELILENARSHGHVVRLKGGDPFVFARGFEELEFAAKNGLETEVIIGVSSINLPGYYGIPLTCRGVNQSFSVVTATASDGKVSEEVVLAAKSSPTTLFFMGLAKIDLIAKEYIKYGRGQLPVAMISKGTLPEGEVLVGTAETICDLVKEKQPKPPSLLIFGEGAAMAASLKGNS